MDCVFCSLSDNKIITQNDCFSVINDACPVSPGHLLIISKRHAENIFELTGEEFALLQDMLRQAKAYLEKEYSPDGYNVGTNTGSAAGQSVQHFHLHVIPRYAQGHKSSALKKGINKLREYYLK